MEWLREFENERGVSYLVVISGSIAPAVLSLYLLEPARFDGGDLGKVLLLCACAGVLVVTICVVASLFMEMSDVIKNPGVRERAESMRMSLVMGGALALLDQMIMLVPATHYGWAFSRLVSMELWVAGGFLLITMTGLVRTTARARTK